MERYRDTTVVIASSEDESLFDCIDSVRNEAKIIVSLTPCEPIEARLLKLNIPHVIVPRGNLGVTFNAGIEKASTGKVIIMTDDATFNPDAIGRLTESLEYADASKARILFQYDDNKPLTKVFANARDSINSSPTRVLTPGLAINKEIKQKMGGHYFDQQVRWAEDAEFSYRFHQNGLRFNYVPEATINHPPVSVRHDLRGAFLIGLSKRRAVELDLREPNENVLPTIKRLVSGESINKKRKVVEEKGLVTAAYMTLWDFYYNFGYNLRRLGLSEKIEENIWGKFGKDIRNTN